MGLLGNILEKLGFGSAPAQAAPPIPAPASPSPQPAAAAKAMAAVDVVAKLEGLAASHKEKLNWKTSIVDLLKLVRTRQQSHSPEGTGFRIGMPGREDERVGADEYVAAQNCAEKAGRERRKRAERIARVAVCYACRKVCLTKPDGNISYSLILQLVVGGHVARWFMGRVNLFTTTPRGKSGRGPFVAVEFVDERHGISRPSLEGLSIRARR